MYSENYVIMPVAKVVQISNSKCNKSVWLLGSTRTHWVSLQRSPNLPAGFKVGAGTREGKKKKKQEDMGQLREGGRGRMVGTGG